MNNPDSEITLTELCTFFEEISNANRSDDKKNVIKKLVEMYYNKADKMKQTNSNLSKSFYPVLRLLIPHEERDRGPYNLKEFTFIKTIVNILGLSANSRDAQFLKNYKASNNRSVKHFSDAVHFVLKQRFNNRASLSVFQVNEYLDEIAAKSNDIRAQEQAILRFFEKTSQLEQKWVVRMLLKELRLGIGRDNVLKAFHPNAVEFYNNVHSLKKICESLQDPNVVSYFKPTVTLFEHFQPMLSTRCNSDELQKAFKVDKVYVVENKFDGERFQLHYKDGEFKYFSRQGFEYSSNFEGYTDKLRHVFSGDIKSIILDGEMMIWNKLTWKFGCKGMTVDVKKIKDDNPKFTRCFCVFDVLLLNDEVVMDKPFRDRTQLLEEIITPIEGVIVLSQQKSVSNIAELIKALNDSMDKEEEGIIFKDPDSVYAPASRKGWWKMKLEYFENVMSDLDVIILGGYYGDGFTRKSIQGYLVGVAEKEGNTTKYLSFAKIQTGLSVDERRILNQKVNGHWIKVSGNEHEAWNIFWGKEAPDVWIKPEHSCCLLVRGSELILIKNAYKTPYTLRFPRILKLRLDKPNTDCLTLSELKNLTSNSTIVQKLNKRHLEMSDIEAPKKKLKKITRSLEPVVKKSNILENREFLVLTGKGSWSKENIENAIRENGGSVIGAETKRTHCMLVGDQHLRVETYKGEIDIVSVDWLRWVLNEGEFDFYTPKDVLYMSPKTRKKFGRLYDKFGDSFTEPLNVGTIKSILHQINDKYDHQILSQREIKDLFKEMNFQDEKVFRGFNVYFDKLEIIDDVNSPILSYHQLYDEIDFIHKGGTVCDTISDNCDFILTKGDAERKTYLKNYLKSIKRESIRIVSISNEILTEHF